MKGKRMPNPQIRLILASLLAASQATAQAEATLLSEFETPGAWNTQGSAWYCFSDKTNGGESAVTTADSLFNWDAAAMAPGADGSSGSLKVGFRFGATLPSCGTGCTYPAQVGIGTNMAGALDITGATAISFWAKADAPMAVSLGMGTTEVTDNGNFTRLVPITAAWTRYVVALSDLTQPDWASPVAFDPAHVLSLGFGISKGDNPSLSAGSFYLDNVAIEGWAPPMDPSRILSAGHRAAGTGTWVKENRLTVEIPAHYAGKPGMVTAVDSKGALLGREGFPAGSGKVEMRLPGKQAGYHAYLRFDGK
jgi:hypothetical protein